MAERRATCRTEEEHCRSPTPSERQLAAGAQPEGSPSPVSNSGAPTADVVAAHTPGRKNKRKMSAPKKRTDFSIKRFCGEGGESVSDPEDDDPPSSLREHPPETPVSTPSGSDQGDLRAQSRIATRSSCDNTDLDSRERLPSQHPFCLPQSRGTVGSDVGSGRGRSPSAAHAAASSSCHRWTGGARWCHCPTSTTLAVRHIQYLSQSLQHEQRS